MNPAYWLNTAWMAMGAAEAKAFDRATRSVRSTQERILLRTLRQNEDTGYGRKYKFHRIKSVEQYRESVPLMTPESLHESVGLIAAGESNVLTRQRVELLEPTGGSTAGEKLIPYTRTLRRQFQRAVAAWVYDVMQNVPGARAGRAYWSISPMAHRPRRTTGGVPIGFADDCEYLSSFERWAVSRLLVAPPGVRSLRSAENARYVTLLYLLASEDLALISIWSPTYLTSLLAKLGQHIEAICADLRSGRLRVPQPTEEWADIDFKLTPNPRRADELQRIFGDWPIAADQFAACWPQLALVSCWADASSARYASQVRALLPQAALQPKGLLATEGVVSFPLVKPGASVLAVRSHFLEFAEVNGDGSRANGCRFADQLEPGRHYRVILTTGGGLYRYDLGDEVQVTGFHHGCPLVRFVGRHGAISDVVGEKLHETHVRLCVERACDELGLGISFALLAPRHGMPAQYRLYIECGLHAGPLRGQQLAARVQHLLEDNPQYRLAVQLGQLQPLDVCLVKRGAWDRYQSACLARGQSLGDIKPRALDNWTGWENVFAETNERIVEAASTGDIRWKSHMR